MFVRQDVEQEKMQKPVTGSLDSLEKDKEKMCKYADPALVRQVVLMRNA